MRSRPWLHVELMRRHPSDARMHYVITAAPRRIVAFASLTTTSVID
jgi:hypothetical protein